MIVDLHYECLIFIIYLYTISIRMVTRIHLVSSGPLDLFHVSLEYIHSLDHQLKKGVATNQSIILVLTRFQPFQPSQDLNIWDRSFLYLRVKPYLTH